MWHGLWPSALGPAHPRRALLPLDDPLARLAPHPTPSPPPAWQIFVADLSGVPFMRVSMLGWRGVLSPGQLLGPADVGSFRCCPGAAAARGGVGALLEALLLPCLPPCAASVDFTATCRPAVPPSPNPTYSRALPRCSWPLPNSTKTAFFLDATNSVFICEFRRPQARELGRCSWEGSRGGGFEARRA